MLTPSQIDTMQENAHEAAALLRALSQHLAKLREDGFVTTRREGQTIYYRIADPRVIRLIGALHDIFCNPKKGRKS